MTQITKKNDSFEYIRYLGPFGISILGCVLVISVSGRESKYIQLLLLVLAAIAMLLAWGRSRRLRSFMLWGLGFSVVINPNFFFKVLTGAEEQFAGISGYGILLTDLVILALLVQNLFRDREKEIATSGRPSPLILFFLALYITWICLSLINAPDRATGMAQIFFEIKCILMFLILGYVVLPPGEAGYSDIKIMFYGVAVGMLIEAALAAGEYTGIITGEISFMGIQIGGFTETFQGGMVLNRIGGTFRHPNYLALADILIGPTLMSAFLTSGPRGKVFWGITLLATIGTLILALSRGGWAGAATAILIWFIIIIRNRASKQLVKDNLKLISAIAVLFVVVAAAFSGPITTKLFKSDPRNVESRKNLNQMAISMINEQPVFGVGISNSNIASKGSVIDRIYRKAFGVPPVIHNVYLLLASEIGIPGLFFLLCLIALVLMGAWKSSFRVSDTMTVLFIAGLTSGLFGYLIADFFGFGLRKMEIGCMFWWQMGLVCALSRRPSAL